MQLSETGMSAAVHARAYETSDLIASGSAASPCSLHSFPDRHFLLPGRSAGHRLRNLAIRKLVRCHGNSDAFVAELERLAGRRLRRRKPGRNRASEPSNWNSDYRNR